MSIIFYEERKKAKQSLYMTEDDFYVDSSNQIVGNCNTQFCNCKINKQYHIFNDGNPNKYTDYLYCIQYLNESKISHRTSPISIVRKFLKNNLTVPNEFIKYIELVRKQDNPTAEELEEKRIRQENQRKALEQEKNEKNKLNNIINKTKASSRLEKLKEQNSISK